MKKYFFSITLVFITAFSFAQDDPASQWTKNNITVDGNAQEWNPPLKHYDNETRLFFDFKNDSNNLYLCFQTKDEMNQAKIVRAGMKIILSNKINGKHKSTINFPLGSKHAAKPAQSKDEIKPDPLSAHQNKHAAFLAANTMMEVKGFANKNGLISSNNVSGIHAAINWDSANTLTYEIAIPLKELFGNDYNVKDISKDISLNVIINAVPMSDYAKNGSAGNGFSEQAGNGQNQANRYMMFQKTELKQKFALSMPK